MNGNKTEEGGLGDLLANLERPTPSLKERYAREVSSLLELNLSPAQRFGGWFYIASILILTAVVLIRAASGATVLTDTWPLVPVALAGGLAFAAMTAYRLCRRSIHRLHDEPYLEAMNIGGLTLVAVTVFAMGVRSDDRVLRLELIGLSVLFLAIAVVCAVFVIVRRYHLETRRKLLDIELALAELAERLDGPKKGDDR